jgi:hypothetical protein
MSQSTYCSRPLSHPDTSTLGKLMRELITATPLFIFITGIKAALQQQQR